MERIWRSVRSSLSLSRTNRTESNTVPRSLRSSLSTKKKQKSWERRDSETTLSVENQSESEKEKRATTATATAHYAFSSSNSISDSIELKASNMRSFSLQPASPEISNVHVEVDDEYCSPADSKSDGKHQEVFLKTRNAEIERKDVANDSEVEAAGVYDQPWKSVDQVIDSLQTRAETNLRSQSSMSEQPVDRRSASICERSDSNNNNNGNGNGAEAEVRELSVERNRPKMGLKAVLMNAKHRQTTPKGTENEQTAAETHESDDSHLVTDTNEPRRSAPRLLSLLSNEHTTTNESNSTEVSNDNETDKVWHKHLVHEDDQSPPTTKGTLSLANAAFVAETNKSSSPVQGQLYDQPWDAKAMQVQLMLSLMQPDGLASPKPPAPAGSQRSVPNFAATDVPPADVATPTKTGCSRRHGSKKSVPTPNVAQKVTKVHTSGPNPGTVQQAASLQTSCTQSAASFCSASNFSSTFVCSYGCNHQMQHNAPNAAIASFVSPMRQRASHRNQTLATTTMHGTFNYVLLNTGTGGDTLPTHNVGTLSLTPTHRRTADDSSICQCNFIRHNDTLVPNPCANCLMRCTRQRHVNSGENQPHLAKQSLPSLHDASASPRCSKPRHESRSWYFGAISRYDAENLLQNQPEGTFLVRKCESSAADYALSIRSAENYVHMKISRNFRTQTLDGHEAQPQLVAKEHYVLGSFSQPYDSVADIVRHFGSIPLPIKGVRGLVLKYALRHERDSKPTVTIPASLPHPNPNVLFRPISAARPQAQLLSASANVPLENEPMSTRHGPCNVRAAPAR